MLLYQDIVNVDEFFKLEGIRETILEYAQVSVFSQVRTKKDLFEDIRSTYFIKSRDEIFKFIVAMDKNLCVGFCIYTLDLYDHLGDMVATMDSMFLREKYRNDNNGNNLINFTVSHAKDMGAKIMFLSARYGSREAKVFSKWFKPTSIEFAKEL